MASKLIFFVFLGANSIMLVKAFTNIKITGFYSIYFNESYFNTSASFSGGLQPFNETFNLLPARWVITKDFPKDTRYMSAIYRNAKDGSREHLKTLRVKLCDLNDKNREYLPDFLVELTADGNCIKKGDYTFFHAGLIKLENMFKESDLDGYNLETVNILSDSDGIIRSLVFLSTPV